jgi:hypothetical protein
MVRGNGKRILDYNCQEVVDGNHQVIVATGVSNEPLDVEHLEPVLQHTIANTGAYPKALIADAGDCS